MVSAMEDVNLEPVVIEDLVKFGEDRGARRGRAAGLRQGRKEGREQGREQGREEGRLAEKRAALRRLLDLRKLPLTPEQTQQIDACTDVAMLDRWFAQAISAGAAAEALK